MPNRVGSDAQTRGRGPRAKKAIASADEGPTPGARDCAAQGMDGLILGVDVGGTKTALLLWDRASETVLVQDAFETPVEAGPEALVDEVRKECGRLLEGCARSFADLRAVGMAVPGQVDAAGGRVLVSGNLSGWVDVPLRELLEARFGVPAAIEHDANAAALGERWRGSAQGMETFAFVALGTGVGVGIVIEGRLHRGAHHAAGELGDMVVGRGFLGQERGGQGNLALLIGGKTLRRRAQRATGAELSAAEAIVFAEEDEKLAAIADDVADYLAIALIAVAALLDPEAIVVGGGTAEAGEDLLDPVRERVAREVAAPPILIASALGPEAQLYGAVFCALHALFTP
jgi:glucokinase